MTAIVVVALLVNLATAIVCFCLGATLVYRSKMGLPPVPSLHLPQGQVESGTDVEEGGTKMPRVRI